MNREDMRLATFVNWPAGNLVSPLQMVTAGLYYTGEGDQVKCFSCNGRIMYWESGDIPMQEHRRHFPQCRFVNNPLNTDNVGFTFGDAVSVPVSAAVRGGGNEIQQDSVSTARNQDQMDSAEVFDGHSEVDSLVYRNNVDAVPHIQNQSSTHPSVFSPDRMSNKENRIQSLRHWPLKRNININRVAEHGIYYTGESDKLKCVHCNGSMINWDDGDDPIQEHDKHFSDRCNRSKTQTQDTNSRTYDALNIITERPKHSQYATEDARLQTFRGWKLEKVQSKAILASAGFYYTGKQSIRIGFCFYNPVLLTKATLCDILTNNSF